MLPGREATRCSAGKLGSRGVSTTLGEWNGPRRWVWRMPAPGGVPQPCPADPFCDVSEPPVCTLQALRACMATRLPSNTAAACCSPRLGPVLFPPQWLLLLLLLLLSPLLLLLLLNPLLLPVLLLLRERQELHNGHGEIYRGAGPDCALW